MDEPPVPPLADDLELHPLAEVGYVGWDWLHTALQVLQTLALIIIAVALVVRL